MLVCLLPPGLQLNLPSCIELGTLILPTHLACRGKPIQRLQHLPLKLRALERDPFFECSAVGERKPFNEVTPVEIDRLRQVAFRQIARVCGSRRLNERHNIQPAIAGPVELYGVASDREERWLSQPIANDPSKVREPVAQVSRSCLLGIFGPEQARQRRPRMRSPRFYCKVSQQRSHLVGGKAQ